MGKSFWIWLLVGISLACSEKKVDLPQKEATDTYREAYRPQYHFSPQAHWMNDPNGLVYHDGEYHLFYQYYPEATVWGPMHWGHAKSKDLVHWEHRPIALFPDGKGLIFSGSAVVDVQNTSGFGTDGTPAMVAIFTYHNMAGEKAGRNDFQTQGIAYSLDQGETWTKYEGNPVLPNPGIRDLRDPKVFWHEASGQWIMALVAGDHAKFYRSPDLKTWEYLSDFGKDAGAHGGVWECPDLFELPVEGSDETKWVLIISIGNGGPNGGSATQYFVGDFDGPTFTADHQAWKWLAWGTDNYAGVTYNHTPGGKRTFIGWMSNWQYALKTPTETWRSAMTLPRHLGLRKTGDTYQLTNYPVPAVGQLATEKETSEFEIAPNESRTWTMDELGRSRLQLNTNGREFELTYANDFGEQTRIRVNGASDLIMVNRTRSGETDFHYEFGNKLHYMDIEGLAAGRIEFSVFLDWSSIELFVAQGQWAFTDQLFPSVPYTQLTITNKSGTALSVSDFGLSPLRSIW